MPLGGAVGLQHGGWCQHRNGCRRQHRGLSGWRAPSSIAARGAARLALGGGFRRATVSLVTKPSARNQGRRNVGRFGSLTPIMLALIDAAAATAPTNWAPFVVVGEGAR